jgi:hypothetical protein
LAAGTAKETDQEEVSNMPGISIWMIRISLIYLMITFITGSILLLNKTILLQPVVWALLPVHIEMAMLGWILQFVLGTAYWMFPRYMEGEIRGNRKAAFWMVITVNTGIIMSAFAMGNEWLLFIGRLFLAMGVILFISIIRGRIVSYRNHQNG